MDKFIVDVLGLSFHIVCKSMLEKSSVVSYKHSLLILGKKYSLDLGYNEGNKWSLLETEDWKYIFTTRPVTDKNQSQFIGFYGDEEAFGKDLALIRLVITGEE